MFAQRTLGQLERSWLSRNLILLGWGTSLSGTRKSSNIACHLGLTGLKRRLSSRHKFLVQCMVPKAHETAQCQIEQPGPKMPQPHIGSPEPLIPHSRNGLTGAMFSQPHTGSTGTFLTRFQIEQSGPKIPQPHTGSSGSISAQVRYVHARSFLTLPRNENAKWHPG